MLPGCDAYGQGHELEWRDKTGVIEIDNNLFHAVVNKVSLGLAALSDQPGGARANDAVAFYPQLYIGGVEVKPNTEVPRLLEYDPVNENYHNNTLEWDYGVCLRRLRIIEGRLLGSWVFSFNPGKDVTIRYNQSGQFRLKLGRYALDNDTEFIPAKAFMADESGIPRRYPFIVSDSATFYPDANPESTSVDGWARRDTAGTWVEVHDGAGTLSVDSSNSYNFDVETTSTANQFGIISRLLFFFNTSGIGSGKSRNRRHVEPVRV